MLTVIEDDNNGVVHYSQVTVFLRWLLVFQRNGASVTMNHFTGLRHTQMKNWLLIVVLQLCKIS